MINTTIGILIGLFGIWFGLNTFRNPSSGIGSGRRTYQTKDYFTSIMLIILAIILITNKVSIDSIFD